MDAPGLKKFKSQDALRRAAEKRNSLHKDQYAETTREILGSDSSCDFYYHSECNRRYCAIKRKSFENEKDDTNLAPPEKSTRSKSDLPHTNNKGVLEKTCLFCSLSRKRLKSSSAYDKLHKVQTADLSESFVSTAKAHPLIKESQRILALGSEDLVAMEAHYHNTCRLKFFRDAKDDGTPNPTQSPHSIRGKHEKVFQRFMVYIEDEIILKRVPKYVTSLLDLYKDEYKVMFGNDGEIDSYSTQSLVSKVRGKYGSKLIIDKTANKLGSFVYPQNMTKDEAEQILKTTSVKEDAVQKAALIIRSEILDMEKTKLPKPTTIQSLKDAASPIPPLTKAFYDTLSGGLNNDPGESTQRRSVSMASDAVFTISRGAVKPWKQSALGLGLSSLSGSKQTLTVLNRLGHTLSYDDCKRLETEIAYTCTSGDLETPAGLILEPTAATGTAWDNYDVNIETPSGKGSLHVTVGIAYQNTSENTDRQCQNASAESQVVVGRPRRSYEGPDKQVAPFRRNLKMAKFKFEEVEEDKAGECLYVLTKARPPDFLWLVMSRQEQLPLFNGFYSQFVSDPLPITTIAYMDPISQPPTRNDVVQETMYRSMRVAEESKMPYHPVTYDLAVASKAFSIQSLMAPLFDRLLILLGSFHTELAFFGALGTYVAESGLEYLLTEARVLAEGSVTGFIHGKMYNRCTRIHHIAATALERALFERFLRTTSNDYHDVLDSIIALPHDDRKAQEELAGSEGFRKLSDDYEEFFHQTIRGKLGETASFWAVYVYLVNRLYREFQRSVRTNDVELYKQVLQSMIEVFFSLNRPNYARWGSYFLERLKHLDKQALEILKAGAFSTRRTTKAYSRSAIDLTLEQSVNRDAASSASGITHFANSDGAFRRWCVTLSQRSMAVSEMKEMSGIEKGETPANQLRKSRVERDNNDVDKLSNMLDETCNPFSPDAPDVLVNIATGKTANSEASRYLLGTLERGAKLRQEFHKECAEDESRFLKPVKRVKVQNFAAANKQKKPTREKKVLGAAEGARDAFAYLLSKADIDLHDVLCYPVTEIPLSLAHADGTPAKTPKANLTKLLEKRQTSSLAETREPITDATLLDGGLVLHEVLISHNTSTYGKIVSDIIMKVCSSGGKSAHLLMDKYVEPSIKDTERLNRGATQTESNSVIITGAEQQQHRKGTDLLKDGAFKEALAEFILDEVQKEYYAPIIGNKTVYVSHGGTCVKLGVNAMGLLVVEKPEEFQGVHEEADTLIAFHAFKLAGRIMVRSSDTDVLVILTGMATRMPQTSTIMMDYGSANNRRIINVTDIAVKLEQTQAGLSEALIAFHALTGCDFNSSFYGKGKAVPFSHLEKDKNHVVALRSLCQVSVDWPGITAFVCRVYGFKELHDINEARYKSFIKMTRRNGKDVSVKKINCASLPPCQRTLREHVTRANYIATMWRLAHTANPTKDIHPLNHGWAENKGHYTLVWYRGAPLPETLTPAEDQVLDDQQGSNSTSESGDEEDETPWSDSESDCDDNEDDD